MLITPEVMFALLTCMDVGMLLHVRLLVKSLSTILAWVRPRVGVDQQVRGQRGAPLERLAALLARERLLVVVNRPKTKGKLNLN